MSNQQLSDDHIRIIEARHHDPFSILGKHVGDKGNEILRVYLPYADTVNLTDSNIPLERISGSDFFQWQGAPG